MDARKELLEIQQLFRDMHTELLEVNKKCLQIAVRLNDVMEGLDEDG